MRFIVEFPYAITPEQNAQNIRNIVDGLYDGQHDVNFNSASIGSAFISNLTVGSGVFSAGNFDFTRLSGVSIYAQSANIVSANITSGTFIGLSSTTGTISTLGSTSATIQTLQNAGYGNFASANITTALIASATITSATITGAKIGTLQGLLLGTAGVVSAVASGTTAQYLRGDVSMQTLNQAAVTGLTTADGPTFDHIHVESIFASGAEAFKVYTYTYTLTATDASNHYAVVTVGTHTLSKVRGLYVTGYDVSLSRIVNQAIADGTEGFSARWGVDSSTTVRVGLGTEWAQNDIINVTIIEVV